MSACFQKINLTMDWYHGWGTNNTSKIIFSILIPMAPCAVDWEDQCELISELECYLWRLVFTPFGLHGKRSLRQFAAAKWEISGVFSWSRFGSPSPVPMCCFHDRRAQHILKFCLCIPPRNPLVVYRLILWWLISWLLFQPSVSTTPTYKTG